LEKSKVKLHPDSDWRERTLGTRIRNDRAKLGEAR
jgi:hypothetical protein